jgi:hypothetical protein
MEKFLGDSVSVRHGLLENLEKTIGLFSEEQRDKYLVLILKYFYQVQNARSEWRYRNFIAGYGGRRLLGSWKKGS